MRVNEVTSLVWTVISYIGPQLGALHVEVRYNIEISALRNQPVSSPSCHPDPPEICNHYHHPKKVLHNQPQRLLSHSTHSFFLHSIITKCFEKLVLQHIKDCLPAILNLHQFAYRPNRSTVDAIVTTLRSAVSHLEHRNHYVRLLFINYSSSFNTIILDILVHMLHELGIPPPTCTWLKDFLTNMTQQVKLGPHLSSACTLSIGSPQGCVLSPLLYSLYTSDCRPAHPENIIVRFAKDTTIVGLTTGENETANWDAVLGVHIAADVSWTTNTAAGVKKAQQRLHFLRVYQRENLNTHLLVTFYLSSIESLLTYSAWYSSCTEAEKKRLHRVVRTAGRINGWPLLPILDLYNASCLNRAQNILEDTFHPGHHLSDLLPSGRRYRSLRSRTNRFWDSFY